MKKGQGCARSALPLLYSLRNPIAPGFPAAAPATTPVAALLSVLGSLHHVIHSVNELRSVARIRRPDVAVENGVEGGVVTIKLPGRVVILIQFSTIEGCARIRAFGARVAEQGGPTPSRR